MVFILVSWGCVVWRWKKGGRRRRKWGFVIGFLSIINGRWNDEIVLH